MSSTARESSGKYSAGSLTFALLLWCFAAVFLALSFGFTPRARTLPQFVGVPALLVATGLVVREVRAVVLHRRTTTGGRPAGEEDDDGESRPGEILAFAWLGGLVLAVYLFGMVIAFAGFLLGFLRFFGKERWWLAASITVGLLVVTYFAFADFFGIRLYTGVVPELLGF
jgi:hypothetical protein